MGTSLAANGGAVALIQCGMLLAQLQASFQFSDTMSLEWKPHLFKMPQIGKKSSIGLRESHKNEFKII